MCRPLDKRINGHTVGEPDERVGRDTRIVGQKGGWKEWGGDSGCFLSGPQGLSLVHFKQLRTPGSHTGPPHWLHWPSVPGTQALAPRPPSQPFFPECIPPFRDHPSRGQLQVVYVFRFWVTNLPRAWHTAATGGRGEEQRGGWGRLGCNQGA